MSLAAGVSGSELYMPSLLLALWEERGVHDPNEDLCVSCMCAERLMRCVRLLKFCVYFLLFAFLKKTKQKNMSSQQSKLARMFSG